MDDVISRISLSLREQGKAQVDLTNRLNISQSSFRAWTMGKNKSYLKYLPTIADYLGVSVEYLMGETDDKEPTFKGLSKIPILGEVQAGYGKEPLQEYDGAVNIPNDFIKGYSADEFFFLRVKGNSMLPRYEQGDLVLVHSQRTADNGEVAVVFYDETTTLKKININKDGITLTPYNPSFSTITLSQSDNLCVLGVAKMIIRNV